jgi:hypothetical protein
MEELNNFEIEFAQSKCLKKSKELYYSGKINIDKIYNKHTESELTIIEYAYANSDNFELSKWLDSLRIINMNKIYKKVCKDFNYELPIFVRVLLKCDSYEWFLHLMSKNVKLCGDYFGDHARKRIFSTQRYYSKLVINIIINIKNYDCISYYKRRTWYTYDNNIYKDNLTLQEYLFLNSPNLELSLYNYNETLKTKTYDNKTYKKLIENTEESKTFRDELTPLEHKFIICDNLEKLIYEKREIIKNYIKDYVETQKIYIDNLTILEYKFLISDNFEISKYLCELDKIDLHKNYKKGLTLIEYKFKKNNDKNVCIWLCNLGNINLKKIYRDNLTIAEYKFIKNKDYEFLEWLLDKLDDFNKIYKNNLTILEYKFADYHNNIDDNYECIKWLNNLGKIDYNKIFDNNFTILEYSYIKTKSLEQIKWLCKLGNIDFTKKTKDNITLMDYILLEKGVDALTYKIIQNYSEQNKKLLEQLNNKKKYYFD